MFCNGLFLSDTGMDGIELSAWIKLRNDLEEIHANLEVPLPGIVVVGQQSVGKSSVIEQIMGIPLPRNSGTCTRNVIKTQRKHGATFKVTISVVGEAEEKIIEESGPNEIRSEITKACKRALGDKQFTKSVVEVTWQDPTIQKHDALVLYDIPGLIHAVEDGGDKGDIQIIRDITMEHVSQAQNIVLMCVDASADPKTQSILQIMKDVDSEGKRTIGVLTKPDRIANGEERDKIKLFDNEGEFICLRGWHVMKCPNQSELQDCISQESAVQKEADFFEKHKIGKCFIDKARCGTKTIRSKLGNVLVDILSEALPKNREDMKGKLAEAETILDTLGPEVNENTVRRQCMDIINKICNSVQESCEGRPGSMELIQAYRRIGQKFSRDLDAMRPSLKDDASKPESIFTHSNHELKTFPISSFEKNKSGLDSNSDSSRPLKRKRADSESVFTVSEINAMVDSGRGLELFPEQNAAVEEICKRCTSEWSERAESMTRELHKQVEEVTERVLQSILNVYEGTPITKKLRVISQSFTKKLLKDAEDRIAYVFTINKLHFTFNEHYLKENARKFEENLRKEFGEKAKNYQISSAISLMSKAQAYYRVILKNVVDTVMKTAFSEMITKMEKGVRTELEKGLVVMEAPSEKLLHLFTTRDSRREQRRKNAQKTKDRMQKALALIQVFALENNFVSL